MPTSTPEVRLSFSSDRLQAQRAGDPAPVPARLVWMRPLRGRGKDLSLLDAKGKELAHLASLDVLDPASRAAAERELGLRYGEPEILAVRSLWMQDGNRYFEVETDRGPRSFVLHHLEREMAWQPDGSARIKDPAGNRYYLPPPARLDAASQRRLAAAL